MNRFLLPLVTIFPLLAATSVALAAEPTPAEILRRVDEVSMPESSHMLIEQTIETTSGDERTFTIESWSANKGEKSVMRFIAPAPSRGIGMLAHDYGENIWAYFPDSDDLRKIASSARKQSMQGSDFSYDDMSGSEYGRRYRATRAGAEQLDGKACWKLELVPIKSSSYKRILLWVDREKLIPYRAFHYDENDEHIKTLFFSDWKQVKGIWTPFTMTMKNLERGSQTVIEVKKLKLNLETDDSKFTTRFLTSF
jgi:outer membrane lipoprotein-sorting protein